MKQHWLVISLALIALSSLLFRCANPLPPDGGPKDERPPQVVQEKSSQNFQTNYTKKPIEIAFDEWVEIRDPFNQIIVSPPLRYPYEIYIKKRSVIFEFDEREELRDSATYTINFGEAIQDFTEGNPADQLRFVFSTGPYIDSLSVRGKIVDARTYEPVEGAVFMLYENTADSVVRTERPFYFARTNDRGLFTIENVKAGTFKGFALLDNNLNYLFDQAQEAIGFTDSLIVVAEGQEPTFTVKLFTEEQPIRLLGSNDRQFGQVRLIFSKYPEEVGFDYQDVGQRRVIFNPEPDTTRVWYDLTAEREWEIYLQKDTLLQDTVKVRPSDRAAFVENTELTISAAPREVKPVETDLQLLFNHPLAAIDTALLRVYQDTLEQPVPVQFAIDSSEAQRRLLVRYRWPEGKIYKMEALPGAVRDIYGLENDTLQVDFRAALKKSFGNLFLTVDSLSADSAYVIRLMEGEQEVESYEVKRQTSFRAELPLLAPGSYELILIEDWNGNGEWDPGDYDTGRQPEPYYTYTMEQLRSNWDLEVAVDLRTLQREAATKLQPPLAPTAMPQDTSSISPQDSLRSLPPTPSEDSRGGN